MRSGGAREPCRQIVRHRGDIGIAVIGASAESGEIEGEAGPVGQVAANQIPLGGTGSKCMLEKLKSVGSRGLIQLKPVLDATDAYRSRLMSQLRN